MSDEDMDRIAHRAAVDAGYADLSAYIDRWGPETPRPVVVSDLERVKGVVFSMLASYQERLDAMNYPDWLNDHDYRSGLWAGRRRGLEDLVRELRYVQWWLDNPSGDRQ